MNKMLLQPPWLNFFRELEQKSLTVIKPCASEVKRAKLSVPLELQAEADVCPAQCPDSDWTGACCHWPSHLCLG